MSNGVANIVMQLSLPPVGHGVHESRVESGSPRRYPIKRARTTGLYLVVAAIGSEQDRAQLRTEIAQVHAHVHSTPASPVKYSGNARDLQLWVAICLFRFYLDQYEFLYGQIESETRDELVRSASTLATGVNVPESAWPQDWAEYEQIWKEGLPNLSVSPEVRSDFESLAELTFLEEAWGLPGKVLAGALGPTYFLLTRGNLPPEFRDAVGWSWSEKDQRRYDVIRRLVRWCDFVNPFLFTSLYRVALLDMKIRVRLTGRALGRTTVLDEPLASQGATPRQRRLQRRG